MVDFYWLVLGVLVVWRVTHLLHAEDGPWNLLVRWRRALGEGFWGKLLDCFYCLSLWIAAPAAGLIGTDWKRRLCLWLGLSAGAILLERMTKREASSPAALYYEDKETEHVLLRKPEEPVSPTKTQPPAS